MGNPKFAQLGHQVIYRFVGGTPENGILSCGFMRKPTAQKSQINFEIPYYSCFILLSGSGEYQDETGFCATLSPGCVVQRIPGRTHSTQVIGDGNWLEFYVSFGESCFSSLVSLGLLHPERPVSFCPNFESLISEFQQLLNQMTNSPDAELFYRLLECQQTAVQLVNPPPQYSQSEAMICRACAMLEKDLDKPLSPEQVAHELCVGYEFFRKQFLKKTGITPGAYRRQKRMTAAQMMLMDGQSVKAVSQALGYSDPFSFSKQFKRCCGISPTVYAKDPQNAFLSPE